MVAAQFNDTPPLSTAEENEMRTMGFDEQSIFKAKQVPQIKIEVEPENWEAVLWYFDTRDYYRYSPQGFCLGLDLPQITSEKELSGRKSSPQDFKFLEHMVSEAANIMNARHAQPSNENTTANPANFPPPPD